MKDTNDDLSLIQQVAELHDKTAFDHLVRKYQSPIRRFFLHQTLGDAQLSDDLAQDLHKGLYQHRDVSRLGGVLHMALPHSLQRVLRLSAPAAPVCR